ncbi:gluconokinase [Caulobacter ginsengisoli]|uniref:Gluconokinase n=1 Tax=Caulobacter ginsengisoli TaxID=400775 RepID=A0ABU0IRG9_9CAUL|nr:gluconokinase [Caulobacter ginsengisoli]MDQ0464010.1 gluconokinase [Caulobacter ginsengisoli]
MGVAGSGKSTLGAALAGRLGWPFQDGDDLHPAANIARMAAGTPLTDADRAPWLAAVADWIAGHPQGVVACSALKRAYRDRLGAPRLVYLRGEPDLIARRLEARRAHFFAPDLLASQFADLEPPGPDEQPIVIDCALPTAAQVEAVLAQMRL